jgi:hypothetical protein
MQITQQQPIQSLSSTLMMCALVLLSGKRTKQAVERFTAGLKLRTKTVLYRS